MHYTIATTTETGERAINGGLMTFGDLPSAYLSLYVQVDDIQASIAKVGELGGTMLHGPMDVPGVGQIGMFTDPEGHMIGLIQPPPENKV